MPSADNEGWVNCMTHLKVILNIHLVITISMFRERINTLLVMHEPMSCNLVLINQVWHREYHTWWARTPDCTLQDVCARAYIHDGQASCTVWVWIMYSRPTWCHLVQWLGPSRVQNWSCQSSTQVLPVSADWMCSCRTNDSHSSLQACVHCAAHTHTHTA